jgi:hypothetical protein
MSTLKTISAPRVDGVDFTITGPAQLEVSGTITLQDPGLALGPFFRALHDAAVTDGLREVLVDVRKLTFVNSSAIRLFVDWVTWTRALGAGAYVLRFRTDRRITWQRTSFAVLRSLGGEVVAIEAE